MEEVDIKKDAFKKRWIGYFDLLKICSNYTTLNLESESFLFETGPGVSMC